MPSDSAGSLNKRHRSMPLVDFDNFEGFLDDDVVLVSWRQEAPLVEILPFRCSKILHHEVPLGEVEEAF